ncbi:hypothetical protein AB3G33_08400 [Flavobacterium sp. WC2421]|uniref:hypothetical protein n=1 Tax=Flavobacterium sp. WC2421 TaxID=3234138 RepID=UPI0034670C49
MKKITFEEYKSAIKAHYKVSKLEDVSGILLNPTPAQLRNLCLMKFENGLTSADENIFSLFFHVKEGQDLRKAIDKFDIGKFKPIISFLKAEKDSDNSSRIELAAILVDFCPRPYNKYLNLQSSSEVIKQGGATLVEKKKLVAAGFGIGKGLSKESGVVVNGSVRKKVTIFVAVFLSLFFMGYTIKGVFFPNKECMQWIENHYEPVRCSDDKLGIVHSEIIVPIDGKVIGLVKLNSSGEHEFFKNEKVLIWYYKRNEVIELFNGPGFHPETGKSLKPITNYIIKKYSLK